MLSNLWQMFSRGRAASQPRPRPAVDTGLGSPVKPPLAGNVDLDWGWPPSNPLDVSAWDQYWGKHLWHGIGPPLFDFMFDDRRLVEVMRTEGMTSVL